MIKRNKEEILEFFKTLIISIDDFESIEINIIKLSEDEVNIEITRMYDFVEITFNTLSKISEFFGTTNIALGDRSSFNGCKTCDYGSSYIINFSIKPIIPAEGGGKSG